MGRLFYILIILLVFTACEVGPEPIRYGEEGCDYCKMTIVDKQHASELVTNKGKVYKFDAIECMINYKSDNTGKDFELELVNDYNNPGELIDATFATYLVSEQISSPMGANLSAFALDDSASRMQSNYGGKLFTWLEIQPYINKN